MELSILLIQQICQLFIMIFFGFLLVRGRVLTAENSKVLSILLLYVACPCAIINSFMIDFMKSITNKSGQAFYNIGKERLSTALLPIPSLAEQHRIVAQIEKLFEQLR